jgi:hypothetical protein
MLLFITGILILDINNLDFTYFIRKMPSRLKKQKESKYQSEKIKK